MHKNLQAYQMHKNLQVPGFLTAHSDFHKYLSKKYKISSQPTC